MTIYIGNLPYDATQDELKACLEQWGKVAAVRILTNADGTSRGVVFVDMVSDRDAMVAISELDGKEWSGRRIRVMKARPTMQVTV